MKISIDHERCTGHGRCYVLAPSVCVDDDAGYGQVRGDGTVRSDQQQEEARRAVEACPEKAISLTE